MKHVICNVGASISEERTACLKMEKTVLHCIVVITCVVSSPRIFLSFTYKVIFNHEYEHCCDKVEFP
jgi:hypothetical protein